MDSTLARSPRPAQASRAGSVAGGMFDA